MASHLALCELCHAPDHTTDEHIAGMGAPSLAPPPTYLSPTPSEESSFDEAGDLQSSPVRSRVDTTPSPEHPRADTPSGPLHLPDDAPHNHAPSIASVPLLARAGNSECREVGAIKDASSDEEAEAEKEAVADLEGHADETPEPFVGYDLDSGFGGRQLDAFHTALAAGDCDSHPIFKAFFRWGADAELTAYELAQRYLEAVEELIASGDLSPDATTGKAFGDDIDPATPVVETSSSAEHNAPSSVEVDASPHRKRPRAEPTSSPTGPKRARLDSFNGPATAAEHGTAHDDEGDDEASGDDDCEQDNRITLIFYDPFTANWTSPPRWFSNVKNYRKRALSLLTPATTGFVRYVQSTLGGTDYECLTRLIWLPQETFTDTEGSPAGTPRDVESPPRQLSRPRQKSRPPPVRPAFDDLLLRFGFCTLEDDGGPHGVVLTMFVFQRRCGDFLVDGDLDFPWASYHSRGDQRASYDESRVLRELADQKICFRGVRNDGTFTRTLSYGHYRNGAFTAIVQHLYEHMPDDADGVNIILTPYESLQHLAGIPFSLRMFQHAIPGRELVHNLRAYRSDEAAAAAAYRSDEAAAAGAYRSDEAAAAAAKFRTIAAPPDEVVPSLRELQVDAENFEDTSRWI